MSTLSRMPRKGTLFRRELAIWIADQEDLVKQKQLRKYRKVCLVVLDNLLQEPNAAVEPASLGPREASMAYHALAIGERGQTIDAGYLKWRLSIFRRFLADNGNVAAVKKITRLIRQLPKPMRMRVRWFRPDQMDLIEDYASQNPTWDFVVHFAGSHGLRRESIASLLMSNMSLVLNGTDIVAENVEILNFSAINPETVPRAILYHEKGKGGGKEDFTDWCRRCPAIISRYLSEVRQPRAERLMSQGRAVPPTVMITARGTAYADNPSLTSMDDILIALTKAVNHDGVNLRVRYHDLRRTFRDEMTFAKLENAEARVMMSHEKEATTEMYQSAYARIVAMHHLTKRLDAYRQSRRSCFQEHQGPGQ